MPEGGTTAPQAILQPAGLDELARLLREARGGPGLAPWGAGSQWARWGRVPGAALDLRALPVEPRLSAANLTVTVPACWRLEELDALLAPHGLWYPIDTGDGGAATVGGHLAAATSGIRRTGLGPARDWVLGMRAVLADGREVRIGGEMIKNVAGYNLHRVLVGSLGMLAVLVEATLRIAPRPERHVTLRARFETPAAAWGALSPLRRRASTLVAAEWLRAGDGVEVLLAFEGPARAVDHQAAEAVREIRSAAGLAVPAGGGDGGAAAARGGDMAVYGGEGVTVVEGDAAAVLWDARRERLLSPAALRLRAGVRPSDLPRLWAAVAEVFAGRPWDGIARGYGGVVEIVVPAGGDAAGGDSARGEASRGAGQPGEAAGCAALVLDLRRRAEALGGYLQVRGALPGTVEDLPWTSASPDGHLHRRLKAVFDPAGVLAGAHFLLPEPAEPAAAAAAAAGAATARGIAGEKGGSAGGNL